jgi:DNA-binding response OmpR family regulator
LKTETAKDLNEASHIVTKQRYDLLLIDIGQKLVDGWNSIEKLKSEHNYLLFIVTSNFDNAYSDQRCKEVGALGLLVKPFEIRDLDNALNLAFTRKNT